jgi:predicted acyl esterase
MIRSKAMGEHVAPKTLFDLARNRIHTAIRPDVEVTDAPASVQIEWNVPIPVRDGTVLRANIFRPQGGGPVPAILSAHPYNKDMIPLKTGSGHGANMQYHFFPQPDPITFSALTSWEAPDPAMWVPLGYAVVNIDLRGGGAAEGEADLFSDQEAEDYFDVIEWVATQPWCSGKIGLEGVSYLAISQYKVAALRPPHLRAICPWEGFTDLNLDVVRRGGGRERGFSVVWAKGVKKMARVKSDLLTGFRMRADRDAWYEALTPKLEAIEAPMLVCGSFSDHSLHSRGSHEAFRRAGSSQKWLYTHREGKWSNYYSDETKAVRRRFFDHFLKGIDNGWDKEPPVRLAIHEAGSKAASVVKEQEWPPKDLAWRQLFLDVKTGSLKDENPSHAGTARFEAPSAELTFSWEAPEDMDLLGPLALRLFVEMVEGDDVFLFVGIRKFRNGKEVWFEGSYGFAGDMVTRGWQRAAHREIDETLSTPFRPVHTFRRAEPLQPGKVVPVEIALLDHATRFRRGDRLQLKVRGKWHFPRDPLRGQFPARYEPSPRGVSLVHSGGESPSRLLIGTRPIR